MSITRLTSNNHIYQDPLPEAGPPSSSGTGTTSAAVGASEDGLVGLNAPVPSDGRVVVAGLNDPVAVNLPRVKELDDICQAIDRSETGAEVRFTEFQNRLTPRSLKTLEDKQLVQLTSDFIRFEQSLDSPSYGVNANVKYMTKDLLAEMGRRYSDEQTKNLVISEGLNSLFVEFSGQVIASPSDVIMSEVDRKPVKFFSELIMRSSELGDVELLEAIALHLNNPNKQQSVYDLESTLRDAKQFAEVGKFASDVQTRIETALQTIKESTVST